ncbi:unnamed protein product, partial [Heterotrigona itama]
TFVIRNLNVKLNLLRCNGLPSTSTIVPKLQYFLSFNDIIPTVVQKESDELLYTVWSLVMVRESVASAGE